jgi:hypothetical protein
VSRKRLNTQQDEQRKWREQRDLERQEAARLAEEQRKRQATPGYRRMVFEEE